ncbi:MAG: hypothetical protein LBC56_01170 [Oscillospiraceae bacterium]|jgi:hypothetical protein|nr:hypothetical protein [Oscillospiraceae bacterium]
MKNHKFIEFISVLLTSLFILAAAFFINTAYGDDFNFFEKSSSTGAASIENDSSQENPGSPPIGPENIDWSQDPIFINLVRTNKVKSEVFKITEEKYSQKYVVIVGDRFNFTFAAGEVHYDKNFEIYDFGVRLEQDEINNASSMREGFVKLIFAQNGALPGKADLTVFLNKISAGRVFDCHLYNYETLKWNYVRTVTASENGAVTISLDSLGNYIFRQKN